MALDSYYEPMQLEPCQERLWSNTPEADLAIR